MSETIEQAPASEDWANAMAEQLGVDTDTDTGPTTAAATRAPTAAFEQFAPAQGKAAGTNDIDMILDIPVQLTVEQILKMQPGDVISLAVANPLVAEVDSVPIMECKCGVFNGQYALKVERLLPASSNELN